MIHNFLILGAIFLLLHLANLTRLGGPVCVEIEGVGRLENPVHVR